jgi:hypothetical protein
VTEAEALLTSGALYGRRALTRTEAGVPVFAGFKPGVVSLYFGDAPIFHADLEGRWQRAYADGRHWHKGLDSVVRTVARERVGPNLVLRRAVLSFAEASDFDARVRSAALDLIDALDRGRLGAFETAAGVTPVTPEELRAVLERIASWDAAAWFAHRERYVAAYGGEFPFVPPDCPNPVVLQATVGGGAGETYDSTPGEFEDHARAVSALLSSRLLQCRAAFLGGEVVLSRPAREVADFLRTIGRVFPLDVDPAAGHRHPDPTGERPHRLVGVHAFLGAGAAVEPDRDWRPLRTLGLVRVTLGLDPRRCGPADDRSALVPGLKAAGIGVGVLVPVTAGAGDSASDTGATAERINALELGPGDLVSLMETPAAPGQGGPSVPNPLAGWKTRLGPTLARRAKVAWYGLDKQASWADY